MDVASLPSQQVTTTVLLPPGGNMQHYSNPDILREKVVPEIVSFTKELYFENVLSSY